MQTEMINQRRGKSTSCMSFDHQVSRVVPPPPPSTGTSRTMSLLIDVRRASDWWRFCIGYKKGFSRPNTVRVEVRPARGIDRLNETKRAPVSRSLQLRQRKQITANAHTFIRIAIRAEALHIPCTSLLNFSSIIYIFN